MQDKPNNHQSREERKERPSFDPADQASGREGGDDSLAEASPIDPRNDEKVIIVNTQRENKTVNTPSQTAANTSEGISNDDDTIDNR